MDATTLKQRTQIDWRRLLHGLTVLIQQRLIFWYTSEDGFTSYEANLDAALALIKAGSHVTRVQERFGSLERKIVSELVLLGHASLDDIGRAVLTTDYVQGSSESKGEAAKDPADHLGTSEKDAANMTRIKNRVRQAALKLAEEGVLKPVNESHFRSRDDNITEAERKLPPRGPLDKALNKSEYYDYHHKISETLESWHLGTRELNGMLQRPKPGEKRQLDNLQKKQVSKKRKMAGSALAVEESDEETVETQGDLILQLNHDKMDVLEMNEHILRFAEQVLGATSGKVLKAVTKRTEPFISHCKKSRVSQHEGREGGNDDGSESIVKISSNDIIDLFPDTSQFNATIGIADPGEVDLSLRDHRKKRRRRKTIHGADEAEVDGIASSDESETSGSKADDASVVEADSDAISDPGDSTEDLYDAPPPAKPYADSPIYHHLLLLSQTNPPLLQRCPATSTKPESFYIPFTSISAYLRSSTILATASSRYGPTATRLIRILQHKGRLDEKTITTLALLPQKTVRSLLSILQKEQFLELCEIPRDAQRSANRSVWLWWYDENRVAGRLLEDCYKSMANMVQRARVEREEIDGLVKKSEREDVVGQEDQFLSAGERKVLKEWRDKEERIWGEVGRLAEMVSILNYS